jgi:membrane-associated progesterone receptor component
MWEIVIIILIFGYFMKDIIKDVIGINPIEKVDTGPIVPTEFTPVTLQKYNGTDDPKIYMGVRGKVYDVSAGASFYGPGGPYANFAGRDASRGLAKNSFDLDCLTDVNLPLDTLSNLTPSEVEALDGWEEHFENKYKVVGTLSNPK